MLLWLLISSLWLQQPKKWQNPTDWLKNPPVKNTQKQTSDESNIIDEALPDQKKGGMKRASKNGPVLENPVFQEEKSGYAIFIKTRDAIEKYWIPEVYQNAKAVNLDVSLAMKVKPPRGVPTNDPIAVDVDLEGIATPDGKYHMKVDGELGEMDVFRTATKKMLMYHSGKMFSDQRMPRLENANLQSYRSYALRYLGALKNQVLQKGGFRYIYVGTGIYMGQNVDRVKVAKVGKKVKKNKKQATPLNRLWTFWQDGEYEVWVYEETHLPAAVFYANMDDHVFANITIAYQDNNLPSAFFLQNNSPGFEGGVEIKLDYAADRTLSRVSFKMRSTEGHDMSFDATLDFQSEFDPNDLRGLPPLDYQKLNPDQLKLLVLTPIVGNLLQLRQQGINLKNFKF